MFSEYGIQDQFMKNNNFISQNDIIEHNLLQQLKQMRLQTQLIQKISNNIKNQEQSPLLALQSVESDFQCRMKRSQSMVSIYSLSNDLNNYSSTYQQRLKFGNAGTKCLHQIKLKCSNQTYQYVIKMTEQNRKNKRSNNNGKNIDKMKKFSITEQENNTLKHQVSKCKNDISQLEQKIQKLKKQNQQLTTKNSSLMSLQARLLKKEQSFIYQKKILTGIQKEIKNKLIQLEEMNIRSENKLIIFESEIQNNEHNTSSENEQDSCPSLKSSKSTICSSLTIQKSIKSEISSIWTLMDKYQSLTPKMLF